MAAVEGNPQQLYERLRAGVASNAEQALVADIMERKIKPRRPRPGSDWKRRGEMVAWVHLLEKVFADRAGIEKILTAAFPNRSISIAQMKAVRKSVGQRKAILYLARKLTGHGSKAMSERQAYHTLEEFSDAASQLNDLKDDQRDGSPENLDHDTLVQMVEKILARK
jgi:hypothetical protein